MKHLFLSLALFTFSSQTFAVDGADILLNNVGSDDATEASAIKINDRSAGNSVFEGFKLNDPFMVQMFTEWRTAGKLDYEVNSWFMKLLQGKYEQASHLLSVIGQKMPTELYTHLRTSEIYLYHKLGLSQRYFDSWVELLKDKKAVESRIGMTLWQYVDQNSANFISKNNIRISKDQAETIKAVENASTPFFIYAKAALALRTG
ncbi:MAG: hypothetical protein KC493_16585, partial [Bacteriovoracaceae bacterium]|nr:hypothetical protein [Bacteriovoracaceae bacterium]